MPQKKILIIDDDEILLDVLKTIYSEHDFSVEICIDSKHALSTIKKCKPDMVLLDIRMPGKSGHEVLAQIKANHKLAHIPVVFMSVSKDEEDIMKSMSSGAADYINKPINSEKLIQKSKEILFCKTRKILLADDDPIVCSIIESHLEHLGFKLVTEGDGNEIFNSAKKEQPDLILLDRLLPGRQGLSILHDLKNDPDTKDIPVIMISVKKQESEILEALKQGADDYIGKPIKMDELSFRIQRILKSE